MEIDTPFVTLSIDDGLTLYDKTTNEVLWRISFALKIVVISEMNISTSNQKEQSRDLCGATVYEVLENNARYAKSCSNMT